MFKDSVRELRSVQAIAICGVMGALAIVLGYVATIRIGDYIRVGFSFLPNIIIDFLYGPVVGGIFGGAMDIIKYLLNPTGPFFPGFTISAIVGAVIYGVFLYRQKITVLRVLAAQLTVKVVVNLVLNSLWLVMLYGYGLGAILPGRIVSNAVMLPIDTLLTYVILVFIQKNVRHLLGR
ncbi:MAG: folate family ECF transporter S component [Lachnospiraceae bacterium]|nr:folate family ECF transporter S component [Lachnospiraceae bacterium]